jgi:hypothetical protein
MNQMKAKGTNMKHTLDLLTALLLVPLGVLVAGCDYRWQSDGIGNPIPADGQTWDGKSVTITGAGAGLDVNGADQCHFVHITRDAGDFEIVARLVNVDGGEKATAGLMARTGLGTNAAMAAVYCTIGKTNYWLNTKSRIPAATTQEKAQTFGGRIQIARKPPLWLRMVRVGKNFAAYKSGDGKCWVPISNVSGGPVGFDGPLEIGLFVSGGETGKTATSFFDSIAIGQAAMRYRTSWVGNTFGSREEDHHVSNGLSAMWVAPDGTCYTSSYWDEGGKPVTSYKEGKAARALPIGTPETAEGGITGDGNRLYVAAVDHIVVLDPSKADFAPKPLYLSVNLRQRNPNHSVVSGMASDGRRLFVADSRENVIRVVSVAPDLAPKKYHKAQAANDGVILAPRPVVVPPGDAHFAPAIVYQTQRGGEGNRYTLPGFTPGREYTVRGHFDEYVDRPANCDPRNRFVEVSLRLHGSESSCWRNFNASAR